MVEGTAICSESALGKKISQSSRRADTARTQPDEFRKAYRWTAQTSLKIRIVSKWPVFAQGGVQIIGESLVRQIGYGPYAVERQPLRHSPFGDSGGFHFHYVAAVLAEAKFVRGCLCDRSIERTTPERPLGESAG